MNYKKIGIVIADRDEYHPFVKMIADAKQIKVFNMQGISFKMGESDVSVLLCGIGKVNAATAATALVSAGCEAILNFGLSGGLGNSKKGGFCLPDTSPLHVLTLYTFAGNVLLHREVIFFEKYFFRKNIIVCNIPHSRIVLKA